MRILLIRHADPDYEQDSLTPQGWKEAELLADKLEKMNISDSYVSPFGRAKDTALPFLEKTGQEAKECEWLKEFPPRIFKPYDDGADSVVWDWLPEFWMQRENFFDKDSWYEEPELAAGAVKEEYDRVTAAFDEVIAAHGYVREGGYYRAVRPNRETIAFFCHFGAATVLLSHLINGSPMVLWHQVCLLPSSLTSLYTEERREGIAQFRASAIGDTGHLYAGGEEPSFAARFCETFHSDERHD